MKINETIKLVAKNLWRYKKEKSYVDFRNALTSVAEEQQEITKKEMIEKALRATCAMCSMHINGCLLGEFLGKCDKLNCIRKAMDE